MKICFLGTSHAAVHLREAAREKGFEIVSLAYADLTFVSQDTPTDKNGNRDLDEIRKWIEIAKAHTAPIVLTSQVPPGFTRSMGLHFHQAETLRMKDAAERARNPEYICVGMLEGGAIPPAYYKYLDAFKCPKLYCMLEESEFSKIAVNTFLASQVDTTNRLAEAAHKVGADWDEVAYVVSHDSRIGNNAYLTPGRWQDSPHLLRDAVTLELL